MSLKPATKIGIAALKGKSYHTSEYPLLEHGLYCTQECRQKLEPKEELQTHSIKTSGLAELSYNKVFHSLFSDFP